MERKEQIELIIRKAVQIFNEDSLRKKLESDKKLVIKFGADPSRPDLHLGHTVPLRVLKLLQDTARKENMTVLIITHNGALAPMADKVIHFKNGTAEKIEINENPIPVEQIEW